MIWNYLAILVAGVTIGLVAARLQVAVQAYWSPILLLPLLAGVLLGLTIVGLSRFILPMGRSRLMLAVLLAALVYSVGSHLMAYWQYRSNFERTRLQNPQVQLFEHAFDGLQPMSFPEFLSYSARERAIGDWQIHGWAVWLSWGVEAAVAVVSASSAAYMLMRERPAPAAAD